MAEYSANALQTVQPNQNALFTETPVPCYRGFVTHRDGSGLFTLQAINFMPFMRGRCFNIPDTQYLVTFGANILVPEGETLDGPISLALTINGEVIPESTVTYTPAAVATDIGNVSRTIFVPVPYRCGCEEIAVRNISTVPVGVQNLNIVFQIPQLFVTR